MNINNNPIFKKNTNFDEAFPFDQIKVEHFLPAIEHSIQLAEININEIATSKDTPTFENTILALENSSEHLDISTSIYYHLFSSNASDEIEKLASKISPILANFSNNIYLNKNLFKRISKIEEDSNSYAKEEARLIKIYYRRFVRNGAALNLEKKEKLRDIDSELASLSPKFSTNVRSATNDFELLISDKKDLEGLPKTAIDSAAEEAEGKNQKGKWLFTLDFPSMMPVMKYLKNREIREKMSKAFSQKCFGDKYDNSTLIKNIVALKHKRAILLGYKNFAEYTLEERMAGSSANVYELLDGIYDQCFPIAKNFPFMPQRLIELALSPERKRAGSKSNVSSEMLTKIPEGQRNCSMASRIGYLLNKIHPEKAWSAARHINNRCCIPPLDEKELKQVFFSILKRDTRHG